MSSITAILLTLVTITFTFCLLLNYVPPRKRKSPKATIMADVSSCEHILAMKGVNKQSLGILDKCTYENSGELKANCRKTDEDTDLIPTNVMQPLKGRAIPNSRLKVCFGVDNAFTTADDARYKHFVREASSLLIDFNAKWYTAGEHASSFIRARLGDTIESVMLIPLVQALTLRLSLQAVHGVDISAVDNTKVAFIAEEINRIWISSKKDAKQPWKDQTKLHEALDDIIPEMDCRVPEQNPLNLILPSYETLWRVVLRCFMEVVFRRRMDAEENDKDVGDHNAKWRTQLHKFLASPSAANLKDPGDDGVAVVHIVKEALRLYPPTRRVYREVHFQAHMYSELIAADLETCQRNYVNKLEGSEAAGSAFNPGLWVKHGERMESGFMPFGKRPFLCPAQATFAYHAIAILVAALSQEVGNDWNLKPNPFESETQGLPLETDRDSYADLRLVKV